jgi:glycerol-3-phosphate dehydrogenase
MLPPQEKRTMIGKWPFPSSPSTSSPPPATLRGTMPHKYELAIIGGGISGLGVALAAAERNLSTLVLEATSPASATSNNTLRIIHGGFRYLQKLQLARVIQSLNDQTYVATTFPDATTPLPCLMPLKPFGMKSKLPVTSAALLYGTAMRVLGSPLSTPQIVSHSALCDIAPQLAPRAPHGALCWHDVVMTDPLLLASQLTEQITQRGVTVRSHSKVTAVTQTSDGYAIATDTGEEILAHSVVNTLGPWLSSIALPKNLLRPAPLWCLGFNVTIAQQIHPTYALAVESPDGRLFFAVPRGNLTAIGTWYAPCDAPASSSVGAQPPIPPSEIAHFIAAWNNAWPEQRINRDAIVAYDAGILPMRRSTQAGPELYGAEIVSTSEHYTEVLSTKYTTFRSQGMRVVARHLQSRRQKPLQ